MTKGCDCKMQIITGFTPIWHQRFKILYFNIPPIKVASSVIRILWFQMWEDVYDYWTRTAILSKGSKNFSFCLLNTFLSYTTLKNKDWKVLWTNIYKSSNENDIRLLYEFSFKIKISCETFHSNLEIRLVPVRHFTSEYSVEFVFGIQLDPLL